MNKNFEIRKRSTYRPGDPLTLNSHDQSISSLFEDGWHVNSYKKGLLSSWVALIICGIVLVELFIILSLHAHLPVPLQLTDEAANPHRFISERAYNHLFRLTSFGPRPTGSHALEDLAVDFFLREIKFIKNRANSKHKIEVDVQRTTGHFFLSFIDGLTSYYANVTNIVVKLSPSHGSSGHSVLVNCHFDSVPDSPGASDDGISCAIMLEVLQALSQKTYSLQHSIIFLFNGAEENLLQATHGFITQHKWAKEIRAFVNLEACGAGGREVVFQAGPNNPWLIQAYASVAPHPFASIVGQEIFQSGLVPSDTDFRIFRDFGKIPGLDVAYISNGYVYHTRVDDISRIPLGSIQRGGDNTLALLEKLATGPNLAHYEELNEGDVVYYDVAGLFMVIYSARLGQLFNVIVIAIVVFHIWKGRWILMEEGVPESKYMYYLGIAVLTTFGALLVGFATNIIVAFSVTLLRANMAWFTNTYWVAFLYVLPMCASMAALLLIVHKKVYQHHFRNNSLAEELWFEALRTVMAFAALALTLKGIHSAFILITNILYPTVGRILLRQYYGYRKKDLLWICLWVSCLSIPMMLSLYLSWNMIILFVPVMGRVGAINNPDVIISILMWLIFSLLVLYLIPLILLFSRPWRVLGFVLSLTIVTFGLISCTSLGFPYNSDLANPTLQKALVQHVHRRFHDQRGGITHEDSGYWLTNVDCNSPKLFEPYVPELAVAREVSEEECNTRLYCGYPYYYPALELLRSSHWVHAPKPNIRIPISLVLTSRKPVSANTLRLTFKVHGADHMSVYLSPAQGVKLLNWTFTPEIPPSKIKMGGQPVYFVYYSHGQDPGSWTFWLDLAVPSARTEAQPILNIAIASHHIHGQEKQSPEFTSFLNKFPPWTAMISFTSAYESWVY